MKRALVLSLVLAVGIMFGVAAGPYVTGEIDPIVGGAGSSFVLGWDWENPYVNWANMSTATDLWVEDADVLDRDSNLLTGGVFGLKWCDDGGRDVFFIELDTSITYRPKQKQLKWWDLAIGLKGVPASNITIWGDVIFNLDLEANFIGVVPDLLMGFTWYFFGE